MAAPAILDFRNSQILLAEGVGPNSEGSTLEMHHCAKFRQNPSIWYAAIAIFRFFKMAAPAILYFKILKFY